MRAYPRNSPQAAARIVALALLADGNLSKPELGVLDGLQAAHQLGLPRDELHQVIHALCEDLLAGVDSSWAHACTVDRHTLGALMAEVDDPELRERVLALCVAVAHADRHLAEGEAVLLEAALEHWGVRRDAEPAATAALGR